MIRINKIPKLAFYIIIATPLITFESIAAPGIPNAPKTVWNEDFQNLPPPTASLDGVNLLSYTGLDPSGQAYTADTPWQMTSNNCNGIITAFNLNPSSASSIQACANNAGAWGRVQQLAQAIGKFNGLEQSTTARNNYAVTAFTQGANPGAGLIMFRTVNNIPLQFTNRFLTTSVDNAAVSCAAGNNPQLLFSLVNQSGAELPISSTAVNVCATGTDFSVNAIGTAPAASNVKVGNVQSPGALKFTGSSVGYIIRNQQGSGSGNDSAFDNPSILDVSPQLDKSFFPASVAFGATSTITFTITNTTDLLVKNGWSFIDTLSPGLTVTSPPTSTCPSSTVVAALGGNSISVIGDLSANMTSCTVSVEVSASVTGTYINDESNISSSFLNPPEPGTTNQLVVYPSADMQTTGTTLPTSVMAGQVVTGTMTCTNAGPNPADNADCQITGLPPGAVVSCTPETPTTAALAVGGTLSCNVSYTAPSSGSVTSTITARSTTPDPDLTNNTSPYTVSFSPLADMKVTISLPTSATPGQSVTGSVTCTNDGPSEATAAICEISGLPTDASISCTPSSPTKLPMPKDSALVCLVTFTAPSTGEVLSSLTSGSATTDPNLENNYLNYKLRISAVTEPESVPTLSELGLIALSSLLALLGLARSRRHSN